MIKEFEKNKDKFITISKLCIKVFNTKQGQSHFDFALSHLLLILTNDR